ncbi:DinB family protein [Rossellomorea vietnamensis]|uniref:DinB family protein n=1 Tax=Rossellomorea vietnamensis TaxID=218284 RepID=A0A5D4MH60_9BACI|nr:DinB family protein [Rossellomorea vietnamensis]TYS00351.1 DinB family protein [Rossellomorea vietnamensis]
MENYEALSESLREYNDFLKEVVSPNENQAEISIAEGSWSIKQIITHMYRWDLYLLEEVLPSAVAKKEVSFPSHNEYNAESQEYSKTVGIEDLLQQSILLRGQLIKELETEKFKIMLDEPITVNGLTHCPNTKTRYSLTYLMHEFVDHDKHHTWQITDFLKLTQTK